MLLLCFFGVRFVILVSTAIFHLLFTISCSGMLSFVFVCFDLVAYAYRLAFISSGFSQTVVCCLRRLAFLRAGAFAFVLLSVAAVSSRSFPFVFVCLLPALLRWFASIVGGQ